MKLVIYEKGKEDQDPIDTIEGVNDELWEAFEAKVKSQGRDVSDVLSELIEEHLESIDDERMMKHEVDELEGLEREE